ncbi:MAG: hypothetical protein IKE55_00530 [Kiritimatiellae bacterium]|nr:hypothetical protein [Kiritimatiellia bacterium]
MKVCISVCAATLSLASLADSAKVVFPSANQRNYEKSTRIAVGADAGEGNDFVVTCALTSRCETAWQIVSEKIPLPPGTAGFAFDFEIQADADWLKPGTSDSWGSAVTWYDGNGEKVAKRPFEVAFRKGGFVRFRFSGEVPANAASATVEIGVDGPNLPPGEKVVVRNATFTTVPRGGAIPPQIVYDVAPPLVYSRFESPSRDPNLVVKYEIVDDGEVDWGSVAVSNVGAKVAVPFVRSGNVVTLKPGRPWSKGINTLVVSARDKGANVTVSHKAFLVGERPKMPAMRLRDDGVTLVDGKPFFPIGIYGVKLLEFNSWNFDRAVGDLKAVGFNLVHSYTHGRKEEFQAAVRKHGLLSWTYAFGAAKGDAWLVEKAQTDPSILAWYTGDDTSMHITPSELLDRDEAVHMLDGSRLSCQADVTGGDQTKSRYQPYVAFSDVFMPELYHVLSENPTSDRPCVARVIRDMEKAKDDIAKYSGGKPRAIWPILQIFHGGRLWHRFPTADEINGMSFAALVNGGNGITWFHYAGQIDRERGLRYSGAFQSQETWAVMTNLSTRIASLAPVLLERTPRQPAVPEILDGEKTDRYGRPSVSVLVKNHNGMTYVLAVNASHEKVRARVFASVPDGEGAVAWENRRVAASGGAFEDDFKGFGVHVYRFPQR